MPCLIPSDMAQLSTIAEGVSAASCDKGSRSVALITTILRPPMPPGIAPRVEIFTLVASIGSTFASVLARLNDTDEDGGWNQNIKKVRNDLSSCIDDRRSSHSPFRSFVSWS